MSSLAPHAQGEATAAPRLPSRAGIKTEKESKRASRGPHAKSSTTQPERRLRHDDAWRRVGVSDASSLLRVPERAARSLPPLPSAPSAGHALLHFHFTLSGLFRETRGPAGETLGEAGGAEVASFGVQGTSRERRGGVGGGRIFVRLRFTRRERNKKYGIVEREAHPEGARRAHVRPTVQLLRGAEGRQRVRMGELHRRTARYVRGQDCRKKRRRRREAFLSARVRTQSTAREARVVSDVISTLGVVCGGTLPSAHTRTRRRITLRRGNLLSGHHLPGRLPVQAAESGVQDKDLPLQR